MEKETEAEIRDIRATQIKTKLLLKAQVIDLKKENQYYKLLIGKIATAAKIDAQELEENVRESLVSYKTRNIENITIEDLIVITTYLNDKK